MNVVIVNQYCENRGDEAAGTALVQNLISFNPNVSIDIIYNSINKLDINSKNIHHRNIDLRLKDIGILGIIQYLLFRKTIFNRFAFRNKTMKMMSDTIRGSDYVFVTPCGACIGIYKSWPFLIRLLFVVREGKRPIFCLNTIGTSNSFIFDKLANHVLRKSKIYVREKKSQDYLKSIGIDSTLGVDTALSLPILHEKKQAKHIGMVVTELDWHPEFKGRDMRKEVLEIVIPSIAKYCINNGYILDIIPHIASEKEFQFISDVRQKIIDLGMKEEAINILKEVKTCFDYDQAISSEEMIIGMRYHSIVLSVKNEIPFLALSYENKMKEVCNYSNCQNLLLDLHEQLTEEQIIKKLMYVEMHKEEIIKTLRKVHKNLEELSKLPIKELEQI